MHVPTEFDRDGFACLKAVVPDEQIEHLANVVEEARRNQIAPGLRNLLTRCSSVKSFATSGIAMQIAKAILGYTPVAVRSILFDKTPSTNWYVTWHQDVSIPVKNKVELEGFGPWSVKEDVLHVQPPAAILEKMVSLRIHLDECSEDNGAIKFISGSHLAGVLDAPDLVRWRGNNEVIICPAQRGDIIAMRPLILHSSSASKAPEHRRVLHIEYAGVELPAELEWAEA
jgi:ectoine hydroxylase-related dioxygenase (phytanoyl-CoA dioxygenase family)